MGKQCIQADTTSGRSLVTSLVPIVAESGALLEP